MIRKMQIHILQWGNNDFKQNEGISMNLAVSPRAGIICVIALMAGGLAACQPEESALEGFKLTPEQVAACEAEFGEVVLSGFGIETCERPTLDGGNACNADSDCEGLCLAGPRQCAPVTPYFGCNEILLEPGEVVTLCVD